MASYLESYGAIEENKARNRTLVKRSIITLVCVILAGLVLYAVFKNYGEERQVKAFLGRLQNHQYQDAYRMWGCTEQTPCRDYAFTKFMEDWGPGGSHADESRAKIALSQSCGNGVFLRVEYPKSEAMNLFVDQKTNVISFAPWPECPGRHWHFGSFIRSLFGGA